MAKCNFFVMRRGIGLLSKVASTGAIVFLAFALDPATVSAAGIVDNLDDELAARRGIWASALRESSSLEAPAPSLATSSNSTELRTALDVRDLITGPPYAPRNSDLVGLISVSVTRDVYLTYLKASQNGTSSPFMFSEELALSAASRLRIGEVNAFLSNLAVESDFREGVEPLVSLLTLTTKKDRNNYASFAQIRIAAFKSAVKILDEDLIHSNHIDIVLSEMKRSSQWYADLTRLDTRRTIRSELETLRDRYPEFKADWFAIIATFSSTHCNLICQVEPTEF